MTTTLETRSGVLNVSNAPNLFLTAANLTEGSLITLQPIGKPVLATQLWIVQGSRIRLAANPNLVIGPGISLRKEVLLVDITKASNATEPTLFWSALSSGFPYVLDGATFTNVQIVNPALKQGLDVAENITSPGAGIGLWTTTGAANQLFTYTLIPPTLPRIVLYDLQNRAGQSVTVTSEISSLSGQNFTDRASSLEVTSGTWLLHDGDNFGAAINELWVVSANGGPNGDGRYNNPSDWSEWTTDGNRISSLRPLPSSGIVLFENPWFGGRSINITADTPDLNVVGWGNLVSAIVVISGTWRVFADVNYQNISSLVFPKGGFYLSGFYPQNIQWAGYNDGVKSIRLEHP